MKIKTSTKFSLLVFAPVLVTFLLPDLFLLPTGILLILITIFDPTVSISDVISFNMWVIGPVLAAFGLFLAGKGLHSHHLRGRSPRVAWMVTWIVFSSALFLAFWIGVIMLTSIGATETPAHIFLGFTALMAAGMTMLAQAFVIPWLVIISKTVFMSGMITPDNNMTEPERREM